MLYLVSFVIKIRSLWHPDYSSKWKDVVDVCEVAEQSEGRKLCDICGTFMHGKHRKKVSTERMSR